MQHFVFKKDDYPLDIKSRKIAETNFSCQMGFTAEQFLFSYPVFYYANASTFHLKCVLGGVIKVTIFRIKEEANCFN